MPKKHTYEHVKNYIESFEGYTLLSKEYVNNLTKLQIQCPKGHIFWMKYAGFQRGNRCLKCAEQKRKDAKKLDFTYVKEYIESFEGYKLLSEKYINTKTKLKIQCPRKHIYWVNFNNFNNGRRCPECRKLIISRKLKKEYIEVKEYIESFEGYKLWSKEYKSACDKLKIQCPKGHIFKMSYNTFQRGHRCSECSGNKKLNTKEIIKSLYLYENIRENINNDIEVTCIYCGKWFIPERRHLTYRIQYISGKINTENRMYCSQQCKNNCPIYGQILYPKGYKPATSREVQPQLRQLVFERDNYTCQKCNKYKDELQVGLHCHHKYPLNEDPIQSADIDSCITLCEDCHKWIHQNVTGCGYGEMRC